MATASEAQRYWRSVFEDIRPQHNLPRDRNVYHTQHSTWRRHDTTIEARVIGTATRVALDGGCTLDQVLFAAFQALLFRYTATTPIVVGWQCDITPPAIWPVRVSPSAGQTFRELLADVRLACCQCGMFGQMPLDRVSRMLGNDREAVDENVLPLYFSGTEAACEVETRLSGELSLSLTTRPDGGVNAVFVGNADRYGAQFIEAMARHYCQLIEDATGHPDNALVDLDVTTRDEKATVLGWSVGPTPPRNVDRCDVRFEEQVGAHPDRLAVVFSGGVLTYAELDARANQMARVLQRRRIGPDVSVALCLRRSPELVTAYLGVVKAGGAVCLLDPSEPAKRKRAVLSVVRPAIVVTQDAFKEGLSGEEWSTLSLAEIATELDNEENTAPGNRATADSSALLLVTSGSSGAPKIVRKPLGYRRAANAYQGEDGPDPPSDERHLLKTDSGTAFTHAELTRPLLTGGTLYIAPERIEHDAWALTAFIERRRISHLLATPSLLSALLESEFLGRCDSLRVVECIGEVISIDLKKRFFERLSSCSLVVSYGCTEALGATSRVCSRDDDPAVVDVGRTAPLMEVFVLDSRLRPCPVAVPGEVYLGGELASEYVSNPKDTAERFVPHGLSAAPGARLFRTGDLGRWLPDGCLEIVGRRDRQVKVRGYRVELGEIEAVLGHCPGVKKVAVMARDEQPGRQIAAYVVTMPEHRVTARDMRSYVEERLPDYMVPSWIISLPEFPLTANGKLDWRALPAPAVSVSGTRAYESPQGDLEVRLAAIWAEVLNVERIGRHDDFFELGGHSLLAFRLTNRLRQEFLVEAGVSDVLRFPVLSDLAQYLEHAGMWS
jgi:amino acid adenylation domain-containing protein